MVLLYPKTHAAWVHPDSFNPKSQPRRQGEKSRPYLPYINPTPLRFELAKPPPDLLSRPPAAGPPIVEQVESAASASEVSEPAPVPVAVPVSKPADAPNPEPEQEALTAANPTANPSAPTPVVQPTEPPPIIPDDTPARTKHEDFLPYFRYPGAGGDTVVMPQESGSFRPPPSSATYQQR